MTNGISISRMIELEMIATSYPKDNNNRGVESYFYRKYSEVEAQYLIAAYYAPFQKIKSKLDAYCKNKTRTDFVEFVEGLAAFFCLDSRKIIKRIQSVSSLEKFTNEEEKELLMALTSQHEIKLSDSQPKRQGKVHTYKPVRHI